MLNEILVIASFLAGSVCGFVFLWVVMLQLEKLLDKCYSNL